MIKFSSKQRSLNIFPFPKHLHSEPDFTDYLVVKKYAQIVIKVLKAQFLSPSQHIAIKFQFFLVEFKKKGCFFTCFNRLPWKNQLEIDMTYAMLLILAQMKTESRAGDTLLTEKESQINNFSNVRTVKKGALVRCSAKRLGAKQDGKQKRSG